jgi:hypothetical protein
MRSTVFIAYILFLLLGNFKSAKAEVPKDSINYIVINFYTWYIKSIKESEFDAFKPIFIEKSDGMTTLDFSRYVANLKQHGFSDTFIKKELASYSECINNLSEVTYSEFGKTVLADLDDFEEANCDFGNQYRWLGGQEVCNGVTIKSTKTIHQDECIVMVDKFDLNEENEPVYWGKQIFIIFKRIDNQWKIDEIHLE